MENLNNTLPKGHTALSNDPRKIMSVETMGEGAANYRWVRNDSRVSKIEAYDEHGQMDWVPWIAIFHGDEIWVRLPAHNLKISYL